MRHPQDPHFSLHHCVRPQLHAGAYHYVWRRASVAAVRSASQANISGARHLLRQHHPGGLRQPDSDQHHRHHQQVPEYTWSVTERHAFTRTHLPYMFTSIYFKFLKMWSNSKSSSCCKKWTDWSCLSLWLRPYLQCPRLLAPQRWSCPPPLC